MKSPKIMITKSISMFSDIVVYLETLQFLYNIENQNIIDLSSILKFQYIKIVSVILDCLNNRVSKYKNSEFHHFWS